MLRQLRRIGVAVGGGLVVTVGLVMVVLPGPAIVVIPAGLAILATEFLWARRLLHRVRAGLKRGLSPLKRRAPEAAPPSLDEGAAESRSSQLRAS